MVFLHSGRLTMRRFVCYVLVGLITVLLVYYIAKPCGVELVKMIPRHPNAYTVPRTEIDENLADSGGTVNQANTHESNETIYYDRQMPLIFIGGMPRSGTTLMRVLLDAHPQVRCGEETRVIPRILGMRNQWERSSTEKQRLKEAGITDDVLDSAISSFILEIVVKHGKPAHRLCNKDPFALKSSVYLSKLFKNGKFLLMVRDGRAVVHSITSRKVTISGFDLTNFRDCMKRWNSAMEIMYAQCIRIGSTRCMPIYYEQLVLHPQLWMSRILSFLELPWDAKVLHHEDYIGKPGGISLSKTEKSTDQVIKPINVQSLTQWMSSIPEDVKHDMASLAPMLSQLGYDPHANPPDYGKPDKQVADNTLHIQQNKEFWRGREETLYKQRQEAIKAGKSSKIVT